MKFILLFCILCTSSLIFAQTNDQLFVKHKLKLLISIADRDRESIKTICKLEKGLVNSQNEGDLYIYTYKSEASEYSVVITFQFTMLYCKKIKFEIIPTDKEDKEIGTVVTHTLKSKFTIKSTSVTNDKGRTTIYFLSNGRYAGIYTTDSDSKKMILTLSRKTD